MKIRGRVPGSRSWGFDRLLRRTCLRLSLEPGFWLLAVSWGMGVDLRSVLGRPERMVEMGQRSQVEALGRSVGRSVRDAAVCSRMGWVVRGLRRFMGLVM